VRLWGDELEGARDEIRAEAKEFLARFPSTADESGSPVERARLRRAAESALIMRSEKGIDRTITTSSGEIPVREFRPERIDGVMFHIHGGGWMTGEPALTDLLNAGLSEHLNLAIVSVDYRLAPEHPYPAGPDDCESAALWVLEHAGSEYGTAKLLIGGESAGAHLSVVTLLRLRDRHGAADRFRGANLVFGPYDLGSSPSHAGVGIQRGSDILDSDDMQFMVEQFTPGFTDEERHHPDVSPLYADLHGMPPALFTVGALDHLVDDTLFFADRWVLSGNRAELLVYPDAPHGCIALPTVMKHWWPRLEAFLKACLKEDSGEG